MKSGIEIIAAERERQITAEGRTPMHDDTHDCREMSIAAEDYLTVYNAGESDDDDYRTPSPQWPWQAELWKPSTIPLRNLVKAGALIAAEIDRLIRQNPQAVAIKCPTCGGKLDTVTYPGGYLSRDQWESEKAGDYVCRSCPDNGRAANKQFSYFWKSEVPNSEYE